MNRNSAWRLGPAALLVGAATAMGAPVAMAAGPVEVACGQVITTDTTLANDLTGCPRHGIIIGADGITLDLNGHTIQGDDTPIEDCPADEPCDVGVVNTALRDGTPYNGPGFDDVTIENGTIRDFTEIGVYVVGARNSVVRRVHTSHSDIESDGVHLIDCTHCVIEDSSAADYSVGFVAIRSDDVRISGNTVTGNQYGGVGVVASERAEISGNTVRGVPEGDGVGLIGSTHSVVRDNDVTAALGGIGLAESDQNLVTGNRAHGNVFVGFYIVGGDDNRLASNVASGNGDGGEGGIHVLGTDDGSNPSDRNALVGNKLFDNLGDGILVDAGQSGTYVARNVARSNSDDGIDLDGPSSTLTDNRLIRNGDLGIEAVAGVVDGGGNVAAGNGNTSQCVFVTCR